MISKKKKKKKKKRSSPKFRAIFHPISQVQTFEGGLFSYGGAIFHFSQKIGLKSTKKHAFLHTSQANALATLLSSSNKSEIALRPYIYDSFILTNSRACTSQLKSNVKVFRCFTFPDTPLIAAMR